MAQQESGIFTDRLGNTFWLMSANDFLSMCCGLRLFIIFKPMILYVTLFLIIVMHVKPGKEKLTDTMKSLTINSTINYWFIVREL